VIGVGFENWIQIDHRHSEIRQIGQSFDDAHQIAAKKIIVLHNAIRIW